MSCNKCGDVSVKKSHDYNCEQRLTLSRVPNSACVLAATFDGVTSTIDLSPSIHACETNTKLVFNQDTCNLEYHGERFLSSGGTKADKQVIPVEDLAGCMNLEDLANVEDKEPEHCAILTYSKDGNCGGGCRGINNRWHAYLPPVATGARYMAGFNAEGCLVKIDSDGECNPGTIVKGYTPNPYSGIWETPAATGSFSNKQYGPVMGTPSHTNDTDCPQYVRLDAMSFICSTDKSNGPMNAGLGLSIKSNRADVNGDTEVITWDHTIKSNGTNYGSFKRETVDARAHQIIRLNPGETASWTVRSFRANFGTGAISNDDGTFAGDTNPPGWTIQAWRAY